MWTDAWIERLRTLLWRWGAGRAAWRFCENLDRHNAPRIASAMAFDAFLSLIPLLAFGGWVLNLMHRRGDVLLRPLLAAAPGPVARLADEEFFRLSDTGAAALAPISFIAFVWVCSGGLSTAMGAIETIFHAEARPWWHRRAIAVLCVMLGLGVAAVVATVIIALASSLGPLGTILTAVVTPVAILVGLVSGLFRFSVRRLPTTTPHVLPGAAATVLLWVLISGLFSLYVRTLARFATLYGGLATVAMLLFWLWLLALALLAGAEINAALEEHGDPASVRVPGQFRSSMPPQRQETS